MSASAFLSDLDTALQAVSGANSKPYLILSVIAPPQEFTVKERIIPPQKPTAVERSVIALPQRQ